MKISHLLFTISMVSSCRYEVAKKEKNEEPYVLNSCLRQLKVLEESFEMCMDLHNEKGECDCEEDLEALCQN